ncbi:MAG: rhodanese-like domain-containing protein [Planctomycetes bacterium]|nr:rhodanese-like domain-containing protein [Planctomycetota bacterium]
MKIINRYELASMLDDNEVFTLINALPEEDFSQGHIPGSVNIPLSDDRSEFAREVEHHVESTDEKIVVYCASSSCPVSRDAADALDQAGFTNVFAYEGGMKDWQAAALPIESGMHA